MTTTAFLIGWALLVLLVSGFIAWGHRKPAPEPDTTPCPLWHKCSVTNCVQSAQVWNRLEHRWLCNDCDEEITAHRARILRKH